MSTRTVWILLLAALLALWGCQDRGTSNDNAPQAPAEPAVETDTESGEADSADQSMGDEAQPPPRNFARLGEQRGLLGKTNAATPGYVFFNPLLSDTTYLVDLDGQVVHTWTSRFGTSGGIYLKDNGNLVRAGVDPTAPVFGGGGQGGWFEELTWDGDVVWEFHFTSEQYRPHHDFALKPNGNILAIAWEVKTVEEAIAAGRNPEEIPRAGLWPDWIVELQPKENSDAEIVWEWHLWDHVIQEFDRTLDNYGVVADHPERLDINAGHLPEPVTQEELDRSRAAGFAVSNATVDNRGADLYHMNAINYNAELDLIAVSLPGIDEILVIDASTTTEEAASGTGGRWGKGGDILYRWGNPANYARGDDSDQRLGGQHDVSWVTSGPNGDVHLLVFNNSVPGADPDQSAVYEIKLPLSESGFELSGDAAYGPAEPVWRYMTEDPMDFFSPFISGAQRLDNGNTLVTEGASGRFFEVDGTGNVVWNYMTPYSGDIRYPDGTTPQPVGPFIYATFRSTHVSVDHPALAGRELAPLDPQPPEHEPQGN
jgi:hypothetical protein